MTKILVFSDSHGQVDRMNQIIQATACDYIFHLGDYSFDVSGSNVYSVKGNCDAFSPAPLEVQLTIEDKSILLVHGHKQKVKQSLLNLKFYALQKKADIVLFGHTHVPIKLFQDELLMLNPGSISLPPIGKRPTYLLLEIDGKDVVSSLVEFPE